MKSDRPFNPLDKINLASSIDYALINLDPEPLGDLSEFSGAGIYALYYVGDFSAYKQLASVNSDHLIAPIYVGKAEASGKRKGGFLEESSAGNSLYKRLNDHAKSIISAKNLDISDFYCRHLVMDETWIALGESMLISKYAPVWNACVDGFGNHDPGKGRVRGKRPKWDTVHPGRPWAERLQECLISEAEILEEIENYLANERPPELLAQKDHIEYGFIML